MRRDSGGFSVPDCGSGAAQGRARATWLGGLGQERFLDEPPVILTALDAIDQHLRPFCEASDGAELMAGVHRQARMWTEDHETLGEMPARRFLR